MARYGGLLGKRVEVHYRAGDVTLPATARMVADSGRSIFLEEHYVLRGRVQTFRWEIPYQCILQMEENRAPMPAPAYDSRSTVATETTSNPALLPMPTPEHLE
jgi:hypothetical protein